MPIYEYRCGACGADFEKLTRMSTRDDEVPCPECSAREAKKQMSAFSSAGGRGSSSSGASCAPSSGFS